MCVCSCVSTLPLGSLGKSCIFSFRKLLSIYVFSYFPFDFKGRILVLIVSVPDHCLSFYFIDWRRLIVIYFVLFYQIYRHWHEYSLVLFFTVFTLFHRRYTIFGNVLFIFSLVLSVIMIFVICQYMLSGIVFKSKAT